MGYFYLLCKIYIHTVDTEFRKITIIEKGDVYAGILSMEWDGQSCCVNQSGAGCGIVVLSE